MVVGERQEEVGGRLIDRQSAVSEHARAKDESRHTGGGAAGVRSAALRGRPQGHLDRGFGGDPEALSGATVDARRPSC